MKKVEKGSTINEDDIPPPVAVSATTPVAVTDSTPAVQPRPPITQTPTPPSTQAPTPPIRPVIPTQTTSSNKASTQTCTADTTRSIT